MKGKIPPIIFFACCFGVLAFFVFGDTWVVSNTFWNATRLKLSEHQVGILPIPAGAKERELVLPVSGIDGKWWIIHTEELIRKGFFRVRHTEIDNSPHGREVHWSSGPIWLLAGFACLISFCSNKPILDCVPLAALYVGPILWLALLGIYGGFLQRKYGWITASFGVLILGTCSPVFEFFKAGNFDHHGLVGWFSMMSILCLVLGGAGCVARAKSKKKSIDLTLAKEAVLPTEQQARRWFIASGVFGAAALWISAATEIPVLVGVAIGGLAGGWLLRKSETLEPSLWLTWGRSGCIASIGFYLLEYFPNHMGWRVEVNHPLYSMAWLGGAEILSRMISWFSGKPLFNKNPFDLARLCACLVFVLLPIFLILWKAHDFFWVADRFLLALHNEHIGEFQPLLKALEGRAIGVLLVMAIIIPVIALLRIGFLFVPQRLSVFSLASIAIVLFPSALMFGLALKQVRWLGIALFLWCLLLTVLFALRQDKNHWPFPKKWTTWILAVLGIIAILILPYMTLRNMMRWASNSQEIPKDLLPNVIARDVVHRILRANPSRMPVILSGPTTSTDLAYYGQAGVIGSLYWENMPGLKAAADIFSAPSADIAKQKLLSRNVTHILLFSWDEFSKDYAALNGMETGTPSGDIFVSRLLKDEEMPQWVRPLFYPIPPNFEFEEESVSLFEIVPDQTRLDSLIAQAIYRLDAGQSQSAVRILQTALTEYPENTLLNQLLRKAMDIAPQKQ
jgi:hypothetical protein